MRISYGIALLSVSLFAVVYWYHATANICPTPLTYHIGELDASFGLSMEEAQHYILAAETDWERAVGRDLFTYTDSETAALTVNFVYDERQELADTEVQERTALDAQRAESEAVIATISELQIEQKSLLEVYEKRVTEYETRLTAYNTEVNRYNDRGGAPKEVYEKLEQERQDLSSDLAGLTKMETDLNNLATKLNQLVQRGDALVAAYNKEVTAYNAQYGFSREFTQGDYQEGSIHVYKFSSESELVKVLMHEFGHALGIDHVDGETSVMYYLLENPETEPQLSEYDLSAFAVVCGDGESTSARIRRFIRDVIG